MKKTVNSLLVGSFVLGLSAVAVKLIRKNKKNSYEEKNEGNRKYHKLADIDKERILELEQENSEKDLELKEYEIKRHEDDNVKEYEINHGEDSDVKTYSIGSKKAV